jgi:multicomponent Na+:H+ antiporter subunit E
MGVLLATIVLALAWILLSGSFTIPNLILGLLLGYVSLFLVREQVARSRSIRPTWRVIPLALLFVKELVHSAWRVAVLVLSPRMELKPGIFAYPLTVDRDFEIVLLANLITLTPGTLSVDVSADRRTLYVHAIDCSDAQAVIADIRNGFEKKIMEAFRR